MSDIIKIPKKERKQLESAIKAINELIRKGYTEAYMLDLLRQSGYSLEKFLLMDGTQWPQHNNKINGWY